VGLDLTLHRLKNKRLLMMDGEGQLPSQVPTAPLLTISGRRKTGGPRPPVPSSMVQGRSLAAQGPLRHRLHHDSRYAQTNGKPTRYTEKRDPHGDSLFSFASP